MTDRWLKTVSVKEGREEFAHALAASKCPFLFPHQKDLNKPILVTSIGKVARRLIEDFQFEPFQMRDLRRSFKTHLLDGEYIDEREIDIRQIMGKKPMLRANIIHGPSIRS